MVEKIEQHSRHDPAITLPVTWGARLCLHRMKRPIAAHEREETLFRPDWLFRHGGKDLDCHARDSLQREALWHIAHSFALQKRDFGDVAERLKATVC